MQSRRLLQKFVVDDYTMIKFERPRFIRNKKKNLQVDIYSSFNDALLHGETNAASIGK